MRAVSRDLWDKIKPSNIHIIRVLEEEEKKKGYEKIFKEIIVEHFPNMAKEITTQVQEARSPIQIKLREKQKNAKTNINQANQN